MSLDIKKSIELQRFVLGEKPEVRNCRFDNSVSTDKLIARSAGETIVYPGTADESMVRKQLELQRMILDS